MSEVDYPRAEWVGSPNFQVGREGHKVRAIVDHITAGSAAATRSWFQNPASQVSSHYVVRRDGVIEQYVAERDTAWANGISFARGYPAYQSDRMVAWVDECWRDRVNPNLECVSIEHEARAGDGLTAEQYETTLALHHYLCERYAIDPASGVVGHSSIDAASKRGCPGPGFPWERLLNDLRQVEQSQPTGKLRQAAEGYLHALWGLSELTHPGVVLIKRALEFEE